MNEKSKQLAQIIFANIDNCKICMLGAINKIQTDYWQREIARWENMLNTIYVKE